MLHAKLILPWIAHFSSGYGLHSCVPENFFEEFEMAHLCLWFWYRLSPPVWASGGGATKSPLMSFTWASHIAASVLTGRKTPTQQINQLLWRSILNMRRTPLYNWMMIFVVWIGPCVWWGIFPLMTVDSSLRANIILGHDNMWMETECWMLLALANYDI